MKKKLDLMLDSGAHSLFNQVFAGTPGKKGTVARTKADYRYADSKEFKKYLEEYIQFVKENEEYISLYVNLDVIFNPEKTWEVQQYMESCGLRPLPVYHFGEDIKWLKMYVDKYDYVGIGGLGQDVTKAKFIKEMGDPVFDFICSTPDRMPRVKTHGFAMTSVDVMFRYPWFSVDSTSWVMTSRFGVIFVPKYRQGKFRYDETPWKVTVSNRSPAIKEHGQHIQTFSPYEQEIIVEYVKSKGYRMGRSEYKKVTSTDYELKEGERWFGKEEADSQRSIHGEGLRSGFVKSGWTKELIVERVIENGLANDYTQRDIMNILYFLDVEKNSPKWPWPFRSVSGMGKGFGLR